MRAGDSQGERAAIGLSISRLLRDHSKDILATFTQRTAADSALSAEHRQNPALFDYAHFVVEAWADVFEATGDHVDGARVGRLVLEKAKEHFPPTYVDQMALTRELAHLDSAVAEFAYKWLSAHPAASKIHDAAHELLIWVMGELTRRAEQRARTSIPSSGSKPGPWGMERFEVLARTASDALYDWDIETDEIQWSEGLTTLFGYTSEERNLDLSWWSDALHPEDKPRVTETLRRAKEIGHRVWMEEYRFRRRDGTWAHVVDRGYFVHDEAGRATHMFGAILDITQTKRAEQERLRMYEEAQQDVRARDDLLSIASHELRTPLCTLRLQLEDLRRRLEGREASSSEGLVLAKVEKALSQEGRLERLISELLDISRISSRGLDLTLEPVDLVEVVERCAEELTEEARRMNAPIRLEVAGPVVGSWNRGRLQQIVRNLLSNAIKYGAGKPVQVRVEGRTGEAILLVQDAGIGIDPKDQERIFERFERAVSERHYGGLGLGLWIVRNFVDAMGGTIGVSSTPGHGSVFRVKLPLGSAQPS